MVIIAPATVVLAIMALTLGFGVVEAEYGKIIYAGSESELSEVVGELARRGLGFSVRATSLEDLFIMRVSGYEG